MTDHHDMPEPTGTDADTPLEPWFQALAEDYHRPPPAPREAMWERIQAARAADPTDDRGAAAIVVLSAGTASSVSAAERAAGDDDLARRRASRGGNVGSPRGGSGRGLSAWSGRSLGFAAAATLLLAAGLAWWTRVPVGAPATVGAPVAVAVSPAPADSAPTDASQPATVGGAGTVAVGRQPAGSDAGAASVAAATGTGVASRGATVRPRPSAATGENARLAAVVEGAAGQAGASVDRYAADAPYRLAAAQYLGQAEALLTVFRAGSTTGDAADPSLQPWARELLTTTRLLLDSPAARDPRLGALLDELEPVLVQIVQLPAARAAEERQLIARSIERSDLMTQLRSAVPAGPAVPQRAGE